MGSLGDAEPVSDIAAAIDTAIRMLGGAIASTPTALAVAGLPHSRETVCIARRDGRLPVRETRIGHRYYVTAAAFAAAFLLPPGGLQWTKLLAAPEEPTPRHRGPGRPRKTAHLVGEAANPKPRLAAHVPTER